MKYLLIFTTLIALAALPVRAQECGPGCPSCSGSGSNSSLLMAAGTFSANYLLIPDGPEETGILNLRGGITSWLDAGIGYAFKADKILWNVRMQALGEKESIWRPAVLIGTGSVQTGQSDQSLYLQVVKTLDLNKIFRMRLSAGAATLIPDFDEMYGLAGVTLSGYERFSAFINYDGKSIHPGISWNPYEWLNVTGLMIEAETPAVAVGFQYSF